MLFEESSYDHGFDAYMDKIEESDAYLTRTDHLSALNGLLRHYLSFVAFWLQPENRPFVTNNLFSMYLGQSGIAILRDDSHAFEKACMHFNKAILIKSIYVNFIDDYQDITHILYYALKEFGSKTGMVCITSDIMCPVTALMSCLHTTQLMEKTSSGHETCWDFRQDG